MYHFSGGVYLDGGSQFSASGTVVINGRSYSGKNVSIRNNKVYVDGVLADGGGQVAATTFDVRIEGPVTAPVTLTNGTLTITGEVSGGVRTTSGDVVIHGNVAAGDVASTSGGVEVDGDVHGDASTISGNIVAGGTIRGSATTVSGKVKGPKRARNE